MKEVERILIERDGLTLKEAKELIKETRQELLDGNLDAMAEILGLEDDYIFDVI